MKVPFSRLALAALLVIGGTPGVAQDGQPVARFEAWDVHVLQGPEGRTCVVAAQPSESLPGNVTRSAIIFMITDWPADGTQTEISVEMGYPLATDVTVRIDNDTTFTMTVVEGETARGAELDGERGEVRRRNARGIGNPERGVGRDGRFSDRACAARRWRARTTARRRRRRRDR